MPPRITAEVELLVLPYSAATGLSVLHRLVTELESGAWERFWCAVAFGKQTGNFPALLTALKQFVDSGGEASITFGADVFSGQAKGTDYDAVHALLTTLDASPTFSLHLYHEVGRTFHPKVYLFDNATTEKALAIIGSSNWSDGGLVNNVEANTLVHLDLSDNSHGNFHEDLVKLFHEYWRET